MSQKLDSIDLDTAKAFSYSWNTLPSGSVYSSEQVIDWLSPIGPKDINDKFLLELGCGNGSLLCHFAKWSPKKLLGIDLGDSVNTAKKNLSEFSNINWQVEQADLCTWLGEPADLVICIGVLHHLKDPEIGFKSVVKNTKSGGRFHCWVYAYEGNALVRYLVEPIRKIASNLPPFFNKYLIALPLSILLFIYCHIVIKLALSLAPLYKYMQWISKERFRFFWHVVFDQLVTPQTVYIKKETIQNWLNSINSELVAGSEYIIERNGNSWKFGGTKK
jgi:SAM-dependent methyltransferase